MRHDNQAPDFPVLDLIVARLGGRPAPRGFSIAAFRR
jgi:hypothetical protein